MDVIDAYAVNGVMYSMHNVDDIYVVRAVGCICVFMLSM